MGIKCFFGSYCDNWKRPFIAIVALFCSIFEIVFAQNITILNVTIEDGSTSAVNFPKDLNNNDCVLVEVEAANPSITFEGNIIGNPIFADGKYSLFLSANSKYLNVKYPGVSPMLVKFREYGITEMPSKSIVKMTIPTHDLVEEMKTIEDVVNPYGERYYNQAMGFMFENRLDSAFHYCELASDLGHPKAAYQLAIFYADPYGKLLNLTNMRLPDIPVKRDMKMCAKYLIQSADAGFPMAEYLLGQCYLKGKLMEKDKAKGTELLEKAAEKGHLAAMYALGMKVKTQKTMGVINGYGLAQNELFASSLTLDTQDLSAATNSKRTDSGQRIALIKVIAPFEGLTFTGDIVGDPEFKKSEYWLYVPENARHIQISYPDFKTLDVDLKKFRINRIEAKNTYKLSLTYPFELVSNVSSFTGNDLFDIAMGHLERQDMQFVQWIMKAADQHHPYALLCAAYLYMKSNFVTEKYFKSDEKKCVSMLEELADNNIGMSSAMLSKYYSGKNKALSKQWRDRAIVQGYPEENIGKEMYYIFMFTGDISAIFFRVC